MLLPSIKDEQLQNILSNKYLNSSAQKKHVAYPLITSVSRGSERQRFDANKQTRQTRWAHFRGAQARPGTPSPLPLPPLHISLFSYSSATHHLTYIYFIPLLYMFPIFTSSHQILLASHKCVCCLGLGNNLFILISRKTFQLKIHFLFTKW